MNTGFITNNYSFIRYFRSFLLIIFILVSFFSFSGVSASSSSYPLAVSSSHTSFSGLQDPSFSSTSSYTSSQLDLLNSTFFGGNSFDGRIGSFSSDHFNSLISTSASAASDYQFTLSNFALDSSNNVFVTGSTSQVFSTSINSNGVGYSVLTPGHSDVFLAKFNSTGSLVFRSSFGGNISDLGDSIAVDHAGNIYITGSTNSGDFPTKNAYQATLNGQFDAFLAKFNSTGSLIFSTYFGGSGTDQGFSIAVDHAGNAYITGSTSSRDFPTKNAFNATFSGGDDDVFLAKFNTNGSLVFSTYLGGSSYDSGMGIGVDSSGNSFVTGFTFSSNFPTLNEYKANFVINFLQSEVFLAKFNSSGNLVFSTILGEMAYTGYNKIGFFVDPSGTSYITGSTSPGKFPVKNAFIISSGNNTDCFVAEFNSSGELLSSFYFGGSDTDVGFHITVDPYNNIFITGITFSHDFPTFNAFTATYSGRDGDIFITEFDANGFLVFSTFLGGVGLDFPSGIAVNGSDDVYIIGSTSSSNFPLKNNVGSSFTYYFMTKFSSNGEMLFSSFIDPSFSIPSSSNSLNSQTINSLNSHTINLLFSSGIVIGLGLVVSFALVEYRRYSKFKRTELKGNTVSFKEFLKNTLTRNNKQLTRPSNVSDQTFEHLEEIEKENNPDT